MRGDHVTRVGRRPEQPLRHRQILLHSGTLDIQIAQRPPRLVVPRLGSPAEPFGRGARILVPGEQHPAKDALAVDAPTSGGLLQLGPRARESGLCPRPALLGGLQGRAHTLGEPGFLLVIALHRSPHILSRYEFRKRANCDLSVSGQGGETADLGVLLLVGGGFGVWGYCPGRERSAGHRCRGGVIPWRVTLSQFCEV